MKVTREARTHEKKCWMFGSCTNNDMCVNMHGLN